MRFLPAVLAAFVWAGNAVPAKAQEHCRLALVLALDVSSSVDADEYVLQRDGLAAALNDSGIRDAILGSTGHVSVAIYEWSGRHKNAMVSDWIELRTNGDIDELVQRLQSAQRSHTRFPTAMGYALGFGATLLARGPDCERRVIDLSGDGLNNDGFPPKLAYKNYPFANITVNGLAVLGSAPDVLAYFHREVRYGFGAFVETSDGYQGYRDAMTRKLFREINDMAFSMGPISAPRPS
jgi:hypothetical protein